jgi:alkylated DNA repair dioxygenase AlkB
MDIYLEMSLVQQSIPYPIGLYLTPDFITPIEERDIMEWLDSQPWSAELSRRTQHYGYNYNYKGGALTQTTPLSGQVKFVADKLSTLGIMTPTQCIVNEYLRDQGIAGHIDNLKFGPSIASVSLGADTVMVFERGNEVFECFLPRRSIVLLTGEARTEWKHGIRKNVTYMGPNGKVVKPSDYRRESMTYRTIA